MSAPTALRRSRLAAPPHAAWPLVAHSRFIADYLGAQWPDAALDTGTTLHGHDRDGAALTLQVRVAEPPTGLTLILRGSTGVQALHLALAAREAGSQLTITHEAVADGDAAVADDRSDMGNGASAAREDDADAPTASVDAALIALLSAPLPAALRSASVTDAAALSAAQAFLADTAHAIEALLDRMAATQGYAQPGPTAFSLAAHVWHLADVEQWGWSQRLPRALAEQAPVLAGVDGDRLAIERRYQQRPWRGAARRFIRLRRQSLQALARFDTTMLARPLHFGGARITAGDLLAAMVAHDHEHRGEMAALWPPA